jgi:SAM-dependent methyltransferase
MRSAELRAKAEAEFHDSAYQEGTRRSASHFYELIDNCSRDYRGFLKERCAGKRVLEYGCGENSVAPLLVASGAESFVGIDISEVAVVGARASQVPKKGPVQYFVMNAEALEFEDSSFDLICGIAILHHLDLEKAFSQIARTLRPGGAAIFIEPLAYNPAINLYRRLTPRLRTEDEHPLKMSDLRMAETYFGGVATRYYNLFSLLALVCSGTRAFSPVRRFLNTVDEWMFARFPFLRRYAWSVSLVLTCPRKPLAPGACEERT